MTTYIQWLSHCHRCSRIGVTPLSLTAFRDFIWSITKNDFANTKIGA